MSKPIANSIRIGRPIRRKDRPGWMIKVVIRPPRGRPKTVCVYGPTVSAAEARANELMRWYAQFETIEAAEEAKRYTLAKAAQTYIDGRSLAAKTKAGYDWLLREHGPVGPLLQRNLAEMTTEDINDWVRTMCRDGHSLSMQRRTVKLVFAILRAAQLDGLTPNIRLDRINIPVQGEVIMRYWLPEEAQQFLAAVDALPEAVAFLMMIGMGLRVGEMRGLTWRDVDLKRGLIHVRQQITDVRGVPTLATPKSKRSRRTLPIPTEFSARLARHLAEVTHAQGKVRPTDYVVSTRKGTAYSRERLARLLTKVAQAEGLPEIHVHGMRHTYAALMRHHGTDIATLSRLMGHSDLRVTETYYGHMYDEDLRRANAPMGRLIRWDPDDDS
ncbi:tyrosine-type recombinase/integrase [Deinococcus wulumuqiensis]